MRGAIHNRTETLDLSGLQTFSHILYSSSLETKHASVSKNINNRNEELNIRNYNQRRELLGSTHSKNSSVISHSRSPKFNKIKIK